jgi:hypothetical protein
MSNQNNSLKKYLDYGKMPNLTKSDHFTFEDLIKLKENETIDVISFNRNWGDSFDFSNDREIDLDEVAKYHKIRICKVRNNLNEGDYIKHCDEYIEKSNENNIIYHLNYFDIAMHFYDIDLDMDVDLHIEYEKDNWIPSSENGNLYNLDLISLELECIKSKLKKQNDDLDFIDAELLKVSPEIFKKHKLPYQVKEMPLTTRIGWRGPMITYEKFMKYKSGYNYDKLYLYSTFEKKYTNSQNVFSTLLYNSKRYFDYYYYTYIYLNERIRTFINLCDKFLGKVSKKISLGKIIYRSQYALKLCNEQFQLMRNLYKDDVLSDTDDDDDMYNTEDEMSDSDNDN